MNPHAREKLITIYIHDEALRNACDVCTHTPVLLSSPEPGRLIPHALSKCWEENSSRCSLLSFILPDFTQMTGLILPPLLPCAEKGADMYSAFMKTWAGGPCEGSVERCGTEQKTLLPWTAAPRRGHAQADAALLAYVRVFRPLFPHRV